MIIAMFLAHLVGDFILQWDTLAQWKSRELKGVLVHGLVVTLVTWLLSLLFNPNWWLWILFIGVTHILIDAIPIYFRLPLSPLLRFLLDQSLHVTFILIALTAGGYLAPATLMQDLSQNIHSNRVLTIALGYAFITLPTWVIVKFLAYGLVNRSAPKFPGVGNRYLGIVERLLITTLITLDQFILVPLAIAAHLILEWRQLRQSDQTAVYFVELIASIAIAIVVGLGLRLL